MKNTWLDHWLKFVDSLSRQGGTILLLFVLTQTTFALTFAGMPKAQDVMYLSVGALLGVLKGETKAEPKAEPKADE